MIIFQETIKKWLKNDNKMIKKNDNFPGNDKKNYNKMIKKW